MGARPLMLDGGGWTPGRDATQWEPTGYGKKNHRTPRKLINRPGAGWKKNEDFP